MVGVSYAIADFVTGGPILDLPVMQGAKWAAQLNRADALSCSVDMRDPDALSLDLRASSEPKKTILLARNDDDVVLAWGIIDDDRVWDEDRKTLGLTAKGIEASWLGKKRIGPATARTLPLTIDGKPNPALDTTLVGYGFGSMGKKLVEQLLTWPGAPQEYPAGPFVLPANDLAARTETWLFAAAKRYGAALADLTERLNGPDFAFDAQRAPDGISLLYVMRHGTEATPRIGVPAGVWSLGGESPISGLKVTDSSSDFATAAWGSSGRAADATLLSRYLMDDLIDDGYPPLDYVDSARQDVVVQDTLDDYTENAGEQVRRPFRSLSFSVQGDATPALGAYRPGDTMILDVPEGHEWLTAAINIRITSIDGDETGERVKIGCEVIPS